MKKITFTFLLLIFGLTVGNAQQYSYRQYTIFDGLPQNQVVSICQDYNGFIWVGTKGGICRFDGKNFKSFSIEGNSSAQIFQIVNYKNTIFINTGKNICFLLDGIFRTVFSSTSKIYSLINSNENLYISTKNKILQLTSKGVKELYCESNNETICHFYVENSFITYTTSSGIYYIDSIGARSRLNTGPVFVKENTGECYYTIDSDIKQQNETGIFILNKGKPTLFNKGSIVNDFTFFSINNYGNLVAATVSKSLIEFDQNGNEIGRDNHIKSQINCIYHDNLNNAWVGTEKGLLRIQSFAFINYTKESGIPSYIWSIIETKNKDLIFASYNGGLVSMNVEGQISPIHLENTNIQKDRNFYMGGIVSSDGTWYLPMGVYILIRQNDKFKTLQIPNNTWTLCCYENQISHQIYFGTTQGVFEFSPKTWEYSQINAQIGSTFDIEMDKFGRIWLCSSGKVQLFDGEKAIDFNDNELSINKTIISCQKDKKGNMWLACQDGLYLYTYNRMIKVYDGSFTFINQYNENYIIAGYVFGFLLIDIDKIYNNEPRAIKLFDRYNGFTGIECGQNGTCVDTKGNVWIPTSESVVKFMPERLSFDTTPPPVFIYTFETAASDLRFDTIESSPQKTDSVYHINHTYNNIRVSFQGLSYPCPERVSYRYRLIGNSDVWNETNESEITFTNLNPGNYRFEVIACNENGFWTKTPTTFSFHIVPAFWQTLFFRIAMIVLLAASTGLIVFWLMKRKRIKERKEQEVERQLINMQVGTINSQLDPHFIFNAITAIGSEVQEKNTDVAYAYFVKVSQLLRNSLKNSGTITRSLAEEIQFVENYLSLQKYRFGERFMFEIAIDDGADMDFVVPKMCIQIFIENAVKHGLENRFDGGILLVSISHNAEGLHISIKDNGIGRVAASKLNSQSTGVGLKAFREFFEIMNRYNQTKAGFEIEDLYDSKGNPEGTVVTLFIPEGYKYIVN